MKFYIASKLKNYEQVRYLASLLKRNGWIHTYDWTIHIPIKEVSTEVLKSIGEKEYEGIKKADVFIVLSPQGRGTHTEFGMAIALNKKIYLCHMDDTFFKCDDNTSSFYWLPQVNRLVGSIENIAKYLLNANNITK